MFSQTRSRVCFLEHRTASGKMVMLEWRVTRGGNGTTRAACRFARRYPARNDAGQIDRTSSRAPRCLAGARSRTRNNNYIVTRRERSRSSVDRQQRSLEASIATRFVLARDQSRMTSSLTVYCGRRSLTIANRRVIVVENPTDTGLSILRTATVP